MRNNYFIESFEEFIRKKRIIECIKRLKKQRIRESFYYSEDDFEWLMEIKSDWLKKKDGRQYIKKDGSEGVFVPYKNIGAKVATTVGGLVVGKLVRKGIEKVANQNKNHKATNDDVNVANRMSQRANRQWDKDNRKIQRDARNDSIKTATKKLKDKHEKEDKKKTTEEIQREKQQKINKETSELIFNGKHKERNIKYLKNKGVTDKQIKQIQEGDISHNHELKNEHDRGCFHITASGNLNATSNRRVIYRKSDGKIMNIMGH